MQIHCWHYQRNFLSNHYLSISRRTSVEPDRLCIDGPRMTFSFKPRHTNSSSAPPAIIIPVIVLDTTNHWFILLTTIHSKGNSETFFSLCKIRAWVELSWHYWRRISVYWFVINLTNIGLGHRVSIPKVISISSWTAWSFLFAIITYFVVLILNYHTKGSIITRIIAFRWLPIILDYYFSDTFYLVS